MLQVTLLVVAVAVIGVVSVTELRAQSLQLHPENPHYFLFRDKPTVLVTSAEHYGAVINLDFDYTKYLDTLAADGMNHTRTWVGAYCEPDGALLIAQNTLAPKPGKFITPWARSDQPGYINGGNRFDLSRFDDAYFARLRDFLTKASARGIVVEVNLFCPFYEDIMWEYSPMNARNNINNVGNVARDDAYTLDKHGDLLPIQEAMTRKVVTELKDFDNIFYEVMNEPYVRNIPMEWQHRIIDVIVETEKKLGVRHLISLNDANQKGKVETKHPEVSIYNYHYAWPPDAVEMNYGLNCVIGDNETGARGQSNYYFRREAWAFITAGGGLFNNLDYSFVAGHEDGTFVYPPEQPGGGNPMLRKQIRILSEFIHEFDFIRMAPGRNFIQSGLPEEAKAFVLSEPGKQYAVYLCRGAHQEPETALPVDLTLNLPAGGYRFEWISTETGEIMDKEFLEFGGGMHQLTSPAFRGDVALRIRG